MWLAPDPNFLEEPNNLPNPAGFGVCLSVLCGIILEHMTRRLRNWTYRDVTDFLREHGFRFFEELDGSHERWIKREEDDEPDRLLEGEFSKKNRDFVFLRNGTALRRDGSKVKRMTSRTGSWK